MYTHVWNENKSNCWTELLKANYDLFTEQNQKLADIYINNSSLCNVYKTFDNIFCLDGYSDEAIFLLITNLEVAANVGKKIVIPDIILQNQPSFFYNYAEGFCSDVFFKALHLIKKICNLTNFVVYQNCSYNINEMYLKFCKKHLVEPIFKCFYNFNLAYNCISNKVYALPSDLIPEKSNNKKKLFSCFNWNAWDHRLGLIALLHYYDLIDEGFITSPGNLKYSYDKDIDYWVLKHKSEIYLENLDFKNDILKKLETIKDRYPLVIDDRTQYTHTDQPLHDIKLKIPLFAARKNSLFEIVTETRFIGEHFFSEKTFTPISLNKPFFIVSSQHALKSLRKIGYKTFSPYIDESYDDIEDDAERLNAIVKEIKKISNLRKNNPAEFDKLYTNLLTVAHYNCELFVNESFRPLKYIGKIHQYVSL